MGLDQARQHDHIRSVDDFCIGANVGPYGNDLAVADVNRSPWNVAQLRIHSQNETVADHELAPVRESTGAYRVGRLRLSPRQTGNENAPAAPKAATPRMKLRLQRSHIRPSRFSAELLKDSEELEMRLLCDGEPR